MSIMDTLASNMDTKVNKSGDTMSGNLVFTNGNVVSKSNYAWNDKPSITKYYATSEFLDRNGDRMGAWEFEKNENGTNAMNMIIKNGTGSGWIGVRLYAKSDGSSWLVIPKSNANYSACSTESHGNNYVRFGNGLQICWGETAFGNQKAIFQQAFKDANYSINVTGKYTTTSSSAFTFDKKTTTQCQIYSPSNIRTNWIAIGYWY